MTNSTGYDYLLSLERLGSILRLDPLQEALRELGDPQDSFKAIQVAGTNGKGSTAAFIEQALRDKGNKVGLYTSPHLDAFNDRIRVDGEWIADADVDRLVDRVKPLVEKHGLTFFEATTAVAFLYFKEKRVGYAVLEVGLGGRLDATTTASPVVTVITNIELDHTHVLGSTIREIAFEKAGVIRKGVPCVTAEEKPGPLSVIRQVCEDRGAPLVMAAPYGGELGLMGGVQRLNAGCAREALRLLGIKGVEESFRRTRWPGRLEIMQHDPLVVMDCAHNPSAMRSLVDSLPLFDRDHLVLVLATKFDKDYREMAGIIAPHADAVFTTEFKPPPRCIAAAELAAAVPGAVAVPAMNKALDRAIGMAEGGGMVLVCGSLFFVSQARKRYIPPAPGS